MRSCPPDGPTYNAGVKTFAVINQKGGVGKTTTVANLGAAAAAHGIRTCLIDLDPQAHLTLHFSAEPTDSLLSTYDLLTGQAEFRAAVVSVSRNLWLVPSVIDLAAAEVELASRVGREQILHESIAGGDMAFDMVMIDCPPSLGLLTLNALAAADEVLIPLQPHFLALQGLGKLLETVALVRQRINPGLRVTGVIFCMYETSTRLAGEVAADLQQFLASARGTDAPWADAKVFTQRIRRNIKLAECPSYGKTIFDYDPHSIGSEDYLALAKEFLATTFPSQPIGDSPGVSSRPARSQEHVDLPEGVEAVDPVSVPVAQPPAESADADARSDDSPVDHDATDTDRRDNRDIADRDRPEVTDATDVS